MAQIVTAIEFADRRKRKATARQVYHGAAFVATGIAVSLLVGMWFFAAAATSAWTIAAWFEQQARR